MDNSKQRVRAPNFCREESLLLLDVMKNYKNIIENKRTDGATLAEKQKAWIDLTKEFNSITTGYIRTVASLQQSYKNLKKKTKKHTSSTIMNIPVDKATIVDMVEEHGMSPDGWKKVSSNTGIPEDTCQEVFSEMAKEANAQEREERRSVLRTGGGPLQNVDNDPLIDKIRGLVGPTFEANYSIYDGDSSLITAQEGIVPIEASLNISDHCTEMIEVSDTPKNVDIFTNDRANLKKSPHPSLTRKRKLPFPGKPTVAEKFRTLASKKLELVAAQRELVNIQLKEEQEKLEHNRLLRKMELEDARKRYEHNDAIRKLQMDKFGK